MLKLFLDTRYQYHSTIEVSEQIEDSNWIDNNEQIIFTFKHLVYYIQYNNETRSRKSLKQKVISIKCVKALQFQYLYESSSFQGIDKTCGFNDRSILHETEEASITCRGRIKINMKREREKVRAKIDGKTKAEILRDGKTGRLRL